MSSVPEENEAVGTAPGTCPTCGEIWSAGECLHTGDLNAFKGWEDWRYCCACGEELFYPLKPANQGEIAA